MKPSASKHGFAYLSFVESKNFELHKIEIHSNKNEPPNALLSAKLENSETAYFTYFFTNMYCVIKKFGLFLLHEFDSPKDRMISAGLVSIHLNIIDSEINCSKQL